MPVRGHGHYKRPYRLRIQYANGKVITKAYHWRGPWLEDCDWYIRRANSDARKDHLADWDVISAKMWVDESPVMSAHSS
jgi:hypothetical protein